MTNSEPFTAFLRVMFLTTRGAAEKHTAQAKGSALTPYVRGERKMLVNYIALD